jgi:hypothetical protein
MVSNVLSMRSIESGELEMHPACFDLRAAVDDLLAVCRLGAQSEIVWSNEEEPLPATVEARVQRASCTLVASACLRACAAC